MSNWINRLELGDLWKARDEEKLTIQELGKKVAERIRKLRCYKKEEDTLEEIAEQFDYVSEEVEEFDYILEELYDWGDISLDGKFGGKKMCWINTRG